MFKAPHTVTRRATRENLRALARMRVFTTEELSKFFRVSAPHAAGLAFDLRKRGFLTQVQRGVYASVPLEVDLARFAPDPYLVVHHALGDRYAFSHRSALSLLGAEQTVRKSFHVTAAGVRSRSRRLGPYTVRVHSSAPGRSRSVTTSVRRGTDSLRVTTPEQTLVDLASLPNSEQDYEEDVEAFRTLLPRVDPNQLLERAEAAPHASTRARVGHLLEVTAGADPKIASVVRALERAVASAGPSYFATAPHNPANRFDAAFKLVYPGGA